MPGSNAGTGWPITVRCAKCKVGRDWRNNSDGGTDLVRTGRTKPYRGGNRGVRGLATFHEYRCRVCKHVGWSRHVDITRKPLEADVITVQEIGERIHRHLKRFEADPKINVDRSPGKTGLHDYYQANAAGFRGRVGVVYIAYQGASHLSKADALKYLVWLDAGNVGRHFEAFR